MPQIRVQVINEVGLHARPASLFIQTANKFQSNIEVRNETAGSDWADAKSILSVLMLAVEQDHFIGLRAEGPDAEEAIKALQALIESDFHVD